MNLAEAIAILDRNAPNPSLGLPDEIFYYISRTTPLVNVDLLIKDEEGRTLLAWRDDPCCGKGWHVPGGIVRFKETLETRIRKVAQNEVGAEVSFDPEPLTWKELIHEGQDVRGHFISFLFRCHLSSEFVPENKNLLTSSPGFLKWHLGSPEDLIGFHEMYRRFIDMDINK